MHNNIHLLIASACLPTILLLYTRSYFFISRRHVTMHQYKVNASASSKNVAAVIKSDRLRTTANEPLVESARVQVRLKLMLR